MKGIRGVIEKKADGGVFVVRKIMKDCSEEDSDISSLVHSEPHKEKKTLWQNIAGSSCDSQHDKTLAYVTNWVVRLLAF